MSVSVNTERKLVEVSYEPGDHDSPIVVFATGEAGDVHNTAELPNDGLAVLAYPSDFSGSSFVEVRDLEGNVLDSGSISV